MTNNELSACHKIEEMFAKCGITFFTAHHILDDIEKKIKSYARPDDDTSDIEKALEALPQAFCYEGDATRAERDKLLTTFTTTVFKANGFGRIKIKNLVIEIFKHFEHDTRVKKRRPYVDNFL